jgi:predicted nucleic acid-binding protein
VRFWDTSALVPALLGEPRSSAVRDLLEEDPAITVWWATEVECASALGRAERQNVLDAVGVQIAFERLDRLVASWHEIGPNERLRRAARRLVRVHDLRAAGAMQLAAATDAAEMNPESLPFVTVDSRLADAARREGFSVLVPAAPKP